MKLLRFCHAEYYNTICSLYDSASASLGDWLSNDDSLKKAIRDQGISFTFGNVTNVEQRHEKADVP